MPSRKPAQRSEDSSSNTQAESVPLKESKPRKPKKTTTSVGSETKEPVVPKESKPRQVVSRESVESEFNALISSIEEEVKRLHDTPLKSKGVKFLRTVNKNLKTLKNHSLRISKLRPVTRRNNANSGFRKPVQISKELAKFTGWNPKELKSRVQVTKFICDYVKSKDLQNPKDKRQILVENDPALKTLLAFSGDKPLTYYSLQTFLKTHFPKPTVTPLSAISEEEPVAASSAKRTKKTA